MDPLSILGAAASVITVVELCTESLNSLLGLQNRYTNADLTIRLLITQLRTLRTALSQISEWIITNLDTIPYHVQTDLAMSLDGCKFLIEGLNDRLSHFEYDENKALNVRKKAQLLWGEKERTDFLTLLSHNIAALQLLLTAIQWYVVHRECSYGEIPLKSPQSNSIRADYTATKSRKSSGRSVCSGRHILAAVAKGR